MTTRIPETPSALEAEGVPNLGDATPGDLATGDVYPVGLPADTPLAVDEYGTTAAEMRAGEPLDLRLSREEPDVLAAVDLPADESVVADGSSGVRAGQGVGRLVESDEGARADTEAELVASDVGTDVGGFSAEEAAMHLEPEV